MRQKLAMMAVSGIGLLAAACSSGDGEPTAAVSAGTTSPDAAASAVAPGGGDASASLIDGRGPWDWAVTSIGQGTKPGIALDGDGVALVAYLLEREGNAGFVNVATLGEGGASIETLQRGYLYGPLDIAQGPNGAVVTYHNHDWEDGAVAVQGESGWDVRRIADAGHDGWDGSLTVASDGTIHVLSIDPAQFGATEGVEHATSAGGGWTVSPVGSGPQPYEWGTDVEVDAAGVLHAVYFDSASSDLIYARQSGGVWDSSPIYEDGDAGRFTVIALGADGQPHVAFIQSDAAIADSGRAAVQVMYGTLVDGAWAFEAVASLDAVVTGFEGARRTVAIDVGPDGPVIAAIDEERLVLSRRVDGGWTDEDVVTAEGAPLQVVGLALDGEGAPHITYATTTGNGPLDGEVWYLEPVAG